MKKLLFIAMAVLFAVQMRAQAEELYLVTTEYPPYVLMENGGPHGLYIDIVKTLFEELDIKLKIEVMPWKRAVTYTMEGRADCLMACLYTKQRDRQLWLTSEPLDLEEKAIIARKDSRIRADSIEKLKDKSFALVREYSYAKLDDYPDLNIKICNNDLQMLNMLAHNRVELAAGDKLVLSYLSKKQGWGDIFETVLELSKSPNYLGFSRKKLGKRGEHLAERVSQKLRELKARNYITELKKPYQ